jgi:hypothetical protein
MNLARLCKEDKEHWEFPQALPQATIEVVGQGMKNQASEELAEQQQYSCSISRVGTGRNCLVGKAAPSSDALLDRRLS